MRVAIVHYWLVGMRGGEKVVESLLRIYPEADLFVHVYKPEAVSPLIRSRRVVESFIGRLPFAAKLYKNYLPLMPMALEQLDLRGYDLIISSESGPAKGVVPPPGSVHVCYCHSPMRYVWNMFHDYRSATGVLKRLLMLPAAHYIRMWDALSAQRVDHFVANSSTVAQRIARYYRRDAEVIPPPVAVDDFYIDPQAGRDGTWLMAGELVPYKRPDLAVQAFNAMGRRLVVVGGGEMLDEIRRIAGPTVTVLGPQPFARLRQLYAECFALVFPGEEDFGIVPVEAMASGRPVLAFGRGGATETVVEGVTGLFFDEQSVAAIVDGVERMQALPLNPQAIRIHAERYATAVFERRMRAFVDSVLAAPERRRPAVPALVSVGG
ncbi:glycosyltransferase [Methylobacterium dankookense]|uniref:D-inositol-3-phosphate glycosyltransferase n=1 Tax=Methylobacterium dankookense TaxID=560405 RepID=A0A564FWN8_9HYPH|nr:glycosyltransferase [Methylobacterium dankookense]GJD54721.1 D-inositol-3-phosphate glycosyltransferase [Methylobacterium dankookense]VUF12589.1 GDP-mannose-dependent alpha-(1-6)-phosphatidylinositol monomannoside mannosyltransferase [Methylobacterium dankookense]